MLVEKQAADHVGAHAPEPDETQFHRLSLLECLSHGPLESCQAGIRVGAEIHAKDRQLVVLDRPGIADCLRVDQLAKAVFLARDFQIVGMLANQLEEPADRGPALVELARRMQESRPVADGRRPAGLIPKRRPQSAQGGVPRRSLGDVGLDRAVAVRRELGELALQRRGQSRLIRGR